MIGRIEQRGGMILTTTDAYRLLFNDYPDVVNVKQMCKMLGGISEKTGYRLLHKGAIRHFTIGRKLCIPKVHVIDFLAVTQTSGTEENRTFEADSLS